MKKISLMFFITLISLVIALPVANAELSENNVNGISQIGYSEIKCWITEMRHYGKLYHIDKKHSPDGSDWYITTTQHPLEHVTHDHYNITFLYNLCRHSNGKEVGEPYEVTYLIPHNNKTQINIYVSGWKNNELASAIQVFRMVYPIMMQDFGIKYKAHRCSEVCTIHGRG